MHAGKFLTRKKPRMDHHVVHEAIKKTQQQQRDVIVGILITLSKEKSSTHSSHNGLVNFSQQVVIGALR